MSLSVLRSIKITFPLISQVLMDTIKEKLWGQLCLAVQAQQRSDQASRAELRSSSLLPLLNMCLCLEKSTEIIF